MHPVIQKQLAAEHIKHMLAAAGQTSQAAHPRRARRPGLGGRLVRVSAGRTRSARLSSS